MKENIYFSFFCSYRPSHEVVIIRQENFTFLYGVYDTITQPRVHNNCSRCTKITVNPYSWCACAAFVKVVIQTKPARTQPILWWKCAHKASFAHVCKDSSNSRWYYKKVQGSQRYCLLHLWSLISCFLNNKISLKQQGLGTIGLWMIGSAAISLYKSAAFYNRYCKPGQIYPTYTFPYDTFRDSLVLKSLKGNRTRRVKYCFFLLLLLPALLVLLVILLLNEREQLIVFPHCK